MVYLVTTENIAVTSDYYDIIRQAVQANNVDIVVINDIKKTKIGNKNDIYIVGVITHAMYLYMHGKKNVMVWFQGIAPEESYLRNSIKIKKIILEVVEKYVLKNSIFIFFVSEAMREHYSIKYNLTFENKHYIMPCFNTTIFKESFFKERKYSNNIFTYAGSLSAWQCFDKAIECYKEIENLNIVDTKFLVLTSEKEQAKKMLENANVRNYQVDFVPVSEVPQRLADAKFGFIIRDDIIINNISTPTKLSTYLGNGVIPIYSGCIHDFASIAKKLKYKVEYNDEVYEVIRNIMNTKIDAQDIYEEYSEIFSNYYNSSFHIANIAKQIKSLLVKEERI